MPKFLDISGNRYGRLVAISPQGKKSNGRTVWKCKCDCGNISYVDVSLLRNGHTQSCGCYKQECLVKNATTHAHRNTRLYTIWSHMKDRCLNSNSKIYKWYGGKGITFCDEWRDFNNFYQWAINNGYNDKLTLDRIDGTGDYEPSNCRWVDYFVQQNNRSSNRFITYNGETKTMAQWCREYGFKWETIRDRVDKLGWSFEKAINTPVKKCKRKTYEEK